MVDLFSLSADHLILFYNLFQARAHQLLLQNRDLLDHMGQLLTKLQDLEVRSSGASVGETTNTTSLPVVQRFVSLFLGIFAINPFIT